MTVRDMSETYTKLFGSIIHSSVWREPLHVKVVWVTMLAMADRFGYVGASTPGLADAARVTREQVDEALTMFLAPDIDSRSEEFEGRRIEKADRGWNILNYERFRDMRDEEVRKEYERNRKREQRAAAKVSGTKRDMSQVSRSVTKSPTMSAHAEASASASAKAEDTERSASSRSPTEYPGDFDILWEQTGRRGVKYPALMAWKKVGKPTWVAIQAAWRAYLLSERPRAGFVKDLSSWLNARGHEQEWAPATGAQMRNNEPFAVRAERERSEKLGNERHALAMANRELDARIKAKEAPR